MNDRWYAPLADAVTVGCQHTGPGVAWKLACENHFLFAIMPACTAFMRTYLAAGQSVLSHA